MKIIVSMLAVTVILAICKFAGLMGAGWGWVFAPIWIPLIEGVLVKMMESIDSE